MKHKYNSVIVAAILGVIYVGVIVACSSTQIKNSLPVVRVAVSAGTQLGLKEGKATQSQINNVFLIGKACYSVTGGNIAPTVAMLQAAIDSYVGDPASLAIGALVTAIYGEYYPKISGNAQLATQVINAIAGGVEDGALAAGAIASERVKMRFYQKCIEQRVSKINLLVSK